MLGGHGAWPVRGAVQSGVQLLCVFEGGTQGDGLY